MDLRIGQTGTPGTRDVSAGRRGAEAGSGTDASGAAGAERGERTDKLDLSPGSLMVSRIARALDARPTIRTERVAEIRARLEAGTYRPDPLAIAQGLIDVISGRRA